MKKGEWKYTFDTITFEDFCKTISQNAFKINKKGEQKDTIGVPNYQDPLFIGFNLATNSNIKSLDIMADLILKYFSKRLLSSKYRSLAANLKYLNIDETKGKIILFSSNGYQGSKLKELLNASWEGPDATLERMGYSELLLNYTTEYNTSENPQDEGELSDNSKKFIEKTKNKLVIITPEKDEEINFLKTQNYDTSIAFKLGCQFISLYYQSVDEHMDDYITKFKNYGIIKKPASLINNQIKDKPSEIDYNFENYKRKINEAIYELKGMRKESV